MTESVVYQCYAVEEPIDITIRAERQKVKITSDLKKLVDGEAEISILFCGKPVERWILLSPLHDSKEVNLHCSKKTADLRAKNLPHLHTQFEVGIHDQQSFPGSTLHAAMAALSIVTLNVIPPTPTELSAWEVGSPDLLANATKKLIKRTGPEALKDAVSSAVEYFLRSNALIDTLRSSAPDLHERVTAAVTARAKRLTFTGPSGGPAPAAILNCELDSLIAAIKVAAPSLSLVNAEEIALGTISEWIMRCPLDFPPDGP